MKHLCKECGETRPEQFQEYRQTHCKSCRQSEIEERRKKNRRWIQITFGRRCFECSSVTKGIFYNSDTGEKLSLRTLSPRSRERIRKELVGFTPWCDTCYRDRHFTPAEGELHCIEGRKIYMHRSGYVMVYYPNHPHAWKGSGCVLLHRLAMENHLGRILDPSEVVHHKDDDRLNNDISNLEVMTPVRHAKHHRPPKPHYVCDTCEKEFQSKKKKHAKVYCSRDCYKVSCSKTKRPTKEELADLIWKHPTSRLASHFGVSSNAVAKWCKKYGINKPGRGYWQKKRVGKLH